MQSYILVESFDGLRLVVLSVALKSDLIRQQTVADPKHQVSAGRQCVSVRHVHRLARVLYTFTHLQRHRSYDHTPSAVTATAVFVLPPYWLQVAV